MPAPDDEERIAALTRSLATAREREADFRQAAFDLNAELLRQDAELDASRSRVAELERLTQTRAFRAVTSWWRLKAALRRR